jgi:hypothetical protein
MLPRAKGPRAGRGVNGRLVLLQEKEEKVVGSVEGGWLRRRKKKTKKKREGARVGYESREM